jgi:hypothetical protein
MIPELIPLKLTGDRLERHKREIEYTLRTTITGLRELHEVRLPNWRKTYEAIPAEKQRSHPWVGASNLVVPIVGIHSDTLLARIMAAVFKTKPIWVVNVIGRYLADSGFDGEELRLALEEFLGHIALEPGELDLYRVYEDAFADVIRYGTVTLKCLWDQIIEWNMVPGGNGVGMANTVYIGPRPEKISYEDFILPPYESSIEFANFKAHRKRMFRHELMERRFNQFYDASQVDLLLNSPDRTSPSYTRMLQEQDTGVTTRPDYGYGEWDIYECWHYIRRGDKKYKVIDTYALKTNRLLRSVYTNYPFDPFVGSRLFLRDGFYYGYGFAELLGSFQEEISQIHNQRRDSSTVANANMLRVDPASNLGPNYRIFPSATLPGRKDEFEVLQFGQPGPVSIDEERLSLDLAERRSGVSPPMQGYGAGTTTKRGIYSAMGTLSLLQEGNTRTDLNVGDIRYMHTKLGRMVAGQYGLFGADDQLKFLAYGDKATAILKALKMFSSGQIVLPVSSSNASVNREVEKQNGMLIEQMMSRHYGMITQMMQGALNPQMPPPLQEYLLKAVKAANLLATTVLRVFNYDEPELYVPEPGGEGEHQPGNPTSVIAPGLPQQNPNMDQGGGVPGISGMVGGGGGQLVPFTAAGGRGGT